MLTRERIKEILSRSVWRTTPAEMSELLRLALVGFDAESAARMSETRADDAEATVRRILLPLAEDTTATECGSCRQVCHPPGEWYCAAYDDGLRAETRPFTPPTRGMRVVVLRHEKCLAAERAAKVKP